jgi:hypothetical protein
MPKLNPDRNITRANHANSKGGFMVRFFRKGKVYQAYFSDHKFGGEKKALAAARKHRDEVEPKHKLLNPLERAKITPSHNTSGTVGIRTVQREMTKKNKKYTFEFVVASWSVAGERHTKAFGVDKYGREKAWNLAVKARAEGIRKMAKEAHLIP